MGHYANWLKQVMNYTKEKMRAYINEYRRKRREYAWNFLGGECIKCSSKSNLEIDHIERETKVSSVASLYTSSKTVFLEELDKCQLLCKSCHLIKTKEEVPLVRKHGTIYCYQTGCRCERCVLGQRKYHKDWNNCKPDT